MRIGLMLGDNSVERGSVEALVAEVKRAEQDGFATAWFPQIFGIDAMTVLAVAGTQTSTIELGTAVVPTYPRHPVAMAQQALSVQAASNNRFALGIGLSHQIVIEGMFGLSFAKPYSHMKEYLAVLAPLIREGAVSHSGSEYRVNASIKVPGASPCPILLAALAPKMLALAGSEADGTVTWMTGAKTLREHIVPRIQEAASSAGRRPPRVVAGLPIAVTNDVGAARAAAASVFQIYGGLPSYRAMLDREGVQSPEEVALIGDEDTVGEQIERLKDIGVTDLLAAQFPLGGETAATHQRTRALLCKLKASLSSM